MLGSNLCQSVASLLRPAYLEALSRWYRRAIVCGPDRPAIALTFDDGPSSQWTPEILRALDAVGARATFFMSGDHVERHAEIARDVVAQGHEPAVHLFTHDRAIADDSARFRKELIDSIEIIERVTARRPAFIRFPFAYLGKQHPDHIEAEFDLRTVHWSFSSMDSRRDADRVVTRVQRWLFPGAIVLLHDGVGVSSAHARTRDATVAALPTVLDDCQRRKFAMVTLSELFATGDDAP